MLKRLLLTLALLILTAVVILAAVTLYDANLGTTAADAANVTYPAADGAELAGYLAAPPDAGPHPTVLMLHEWWGLNHDIALLADALAAEGFVVLVPDAYRGRVATQVPGALALRLGTAESQIAADIDAGLAYLRGLPDVDPARVASLGFCFGGEQSLQLALRQPDQLITMIMLYGSMETDPAALQPLTQLDPILGIFGGADAQIPVAEVRAFEDALAAAGVAHTVTVYPTMGHAFVTPDNYDQPGEPGDAWSQLVTFLNTHAR
ncbi:MAG: dienelactone hydrolase family protein [Anaerolineales bacterium]|nr:dienelactone hydrolase family protein [Anaerolineales bacterium]